MTTTPPPSAQRRDAQRSRDAILAAASDLFSLGRDVPMYEVARAAGVGQATLYRHFPDRWALVSALFESHVDALEQLAAAHAGEPDAFVLLLHDVARSQAEKGGLVAILRQDEQAGPQIERLAQRIRDLFAQPLADARAAGRVREDLTPDDVLTILSMLVGARDQPAPRGDRAATVARALALVLDGVALTGAPGPRAGSRSSG